MTKITCRNKITQRTNERKSIHPISTLVAESATPFQITPSTQLCKAWRALSTSLHFIAFFDLGKHNLFFTLSLSLLLTRVLPRPQLFSYFHLCQPISDSITFTSRVFCQLLNHRSFLELYAHVMHFEEAESGSTFCRMKTIIYFTVTVKPCYTGPNNNGNPQITNAKILVFSSHFL